MGSTNTFKPRPDPKDYQFCKLSNATLVKLPGSINGLDFILEDLTDCKVFLLDHSSQVQIDGCKRCEIVIGPIDGSTFFRDCSDCKVAVACRQLRTRDCHGVDFSLHVATDPVIESSSDVRICPWAPSYPEAAAQFKAGNLNPGQNKWDSVYDFTPPGPKDPLHWSVLGEGERPNWSVPILETLSKKPSTGAHSENGSPLEAVNVAVLAADVSSNGSGFVKPVAVEGNLPAGTRDASPGSGGEPESVERTPGAEQPVGSGETEIATAFQDEPMSSSVVDPLAETRETGNADNGTDGLAGGVTQTARLQESSSNDNGAGLAGDASTPEGLLTGGGSRLEEQGESRPADVPDASDATHKKKQGMVTSVLQAVRRFFSRLAIPWRRSARSAG